MKTRMDKLTAIAGVTALLALAACSQDAMLLSDSSLEPNTIRGLMEQGEWLPANLTKE